MEQFLGAEPPCSKFAVGLEMVKEMAWDSDGMRMSVVTKGEKWK